MTHQAVDSLSHLQTTGKHDKLLGDDLHLHAIDAERDHKSILVIIAKSESIIPLNAKSETSIDTPPTLEEVIVERALDDYCKAVSLHVRHAGSGFHIDQREFLVRKSIVNESIQIVEPASLQVLILYLTHHPFIVGYTNSDGCAER